MKKINKIIILLFLFLFPFYVNAKKVSEVDYEITNVYMNATVDILGSIHVQEAIIVKGALNGFEREIAYKNSKFEEWEPGKVNFEGSSFYNGRGVAFSKAHSFKIDKDEIGFDVLPGFFDESYNKVDSAKIGDSGVYTVEEYDDGKKVRIYNPNEDGYVVYVFDYYVNQTAVLHNDVAEIYWTFLPQDFDDVKNISIQLTLPGNNTNEKFRFWAHGPSEGKISGISTALDEEGNVLYNGVYLEAKNVKSGAGVDIRMTFDKSMMSIVEQMLNHSTQDAFDEIIKVETKRADEANHLRLINKIIYFIFAFVILVYLVILIIYWIFLYFKHDKEYDSNFKAKYYREFIEDYDVAIVDYIMTKTISTKAFTASILNLIYKKKITISESSNKKEKYILTLQNEKQVNDTEKILIDLLFNKIGNGKEVTIKEIEKYSSSSITCENFLSSYNEWKNSLLVTAEREHFFEKNTKYKIVGALYIVLGFIIGMVSISVNVIDAFLLIPLAVFIIAFLVYIIAFKKWTNRGREDSLKWKAFKNFLVDFGTFDKKELPEIKLWEKYLVYATVLGVADKVEDAMKINLTNLTDKEMNILPNYLFYSDLHFTSSLTTSMTSSIINSQSISASSSSGSGYGGGMSSGGGFAGGGGGGRGF